jgi:xanthine dehydrogenase YagT iron-sulfur-binding subunit
VPETKVTLRVNGTDHIIDIEPRVTLLAALREVIGLTGTKLGCDRGECGACTVHVGGRRINACLTFAVMHDGDEITTVEGLAREGARASRIRCNPPSSRATRSSAVSARPAS